MELNKKHPYYIEDLKAVLSVKNVTNLQGKHILITGATGLLGTHLIDALMMLGNVGIYAVGRSGKRALKRLGEYFSQPGFNFIEQDVCHPFGDDIEVDYIIPCASNTHPLAYAQYPIETIMVNIKGTENALNLADRYKATVLYPSTVEVYGNARNQDVFTEEYTGILNLETSRACYTESKRVGEAMCQSYIAERNVDVKLVRLSRIFGPTMLESDSKASSQFIKKAVANENIVLKSAGEQYFSYTYVADAVAAMLHVMLNGETGVPYNVSNDACNVRLKEFAQLCAEYNGKEVTYDIPTQTEAKGYSIATKAILDNSRLKGIGFESKYEMKDAIYRTVSILR